MMYEIRLTMIQEYDRSANGGRHLLRLMPIDDPAGGQRMIAGSVEIKPAPRERVDGYDFFGNRTAEVIFGDSHDELSFTLRARVERAGVPLDGDRSPRLGALESEIQSVLSLDAGSPHHFVNASPLVRPSREIDAYVNAIVDDQMSVLEAVKALNLQLNRDMRYDGEATTVDTPLEEAFRKRRGVCQDFSHIMIACLRQIGVPAGYVSGFLRTEPPKGKPRLEGADAMHAWIHAWCGLDHGWVEFDPTNALIVGTDHVVVARGRDYSDVAPVKGILWTSGEQKTEQRVDVIPLT